MLEKYPNCGEIVEPVVLLSNPPVYKNICKNNDTEYRELKHLDIKEIKGKWYIND